jgi:hypothetical protein
MHNAAGDRIEIEPDDRNDTYLEVVSDLVAIIDHVRASLKLIERATALEASLGNPEVCGSVIVLDDVTPRYIKATTALTVCDVNLGIALRSLQESRTSRRGTGELAAS